MNSLSALDETQGREMIWIASYPRSGNTFLRQVLRRAFGLPSSSKYPSGSEGAADVLSLPNDTCDSQSKPMFIKTHENPVDDGKAIYIIRDGRAALSSYYRFQNDIVKSPTEMEEIIDGSTWPGSWSDHYAMWRPMERSNTLLIRFEDLCFKLVKTIRQLERFLDQEAIDLSLSSKNLFEENKVLSPNFFRVGEDSLGINEMLPYATMFNEYHSRQMIELGYFQSDQDAKEWELSHPATSTIG